MYIDRNELLLSDNYKAMVRIAICDWLNYWAVNGTSTISDETLRANTDGFIRNFLYNPDMFVQKLAYLAISEPSVKDAVEVSDQNVSTAINNLLTYSLGYIL